MRQIRLINTSDHTDLSRLIVLVNGFQKKAKKTPKSEIELAEKLKKEYFDGKEEK